MSRFLTILLSLGFVLGIAAAASANEIGLGARAVGMGGAFVAVADDGTAPVWNPAGITQLKVTALTPTLSINGDFAIPETSVGDEFPPDLGNLDVRLDGMVGVLFKGIGISLILDADGETSSNASVSTADTSVQGIGLLTLAHEFGEFFALGANLKVLYGQGLYLDADASDPSSSYYIDSSWTGYAVDAGFLVKLGEIVRLGAVYENAFSQMDGEEQTFNYNGSDWVPAGSGLENEYELPAVLHLGAAFKVPVAGTLIAVQVDDAEADGEALQYRLGFEQTLLAVKLRGGAALDEDFSAVWYTAGAGFKLGPVICDVAAIADDEFEFDTFMLTAGFKF